MKKKLIMMFMMWAMLICVGPATGVSIVMASIPESTAPPADAVVGESYINKASGALCTLLSEKYPKEQESKFWSMDGQKEAVECKPADEGTPQEIYLSDAERTVTLGLDPILEYDLIYFDLQIPNMVKNEFHNQYLYIVKLYIVNTKTYKLFKTVQYNSLKNKILSGIIYSFDSFLTVLFQNEVADEKLKLFDLNTTGPGIYDFIVEVIDPENNRSSAAVPINVQYIAPQ